MSNVRGQEGRVRFTVRADRQLIRAGARSRRFLCAAIQANGVPLERLRRLLEVVRTLAVPAKVVH